MCKVLTYTVELILASPFPASHSLPPSIPLPYIHHTTTKANARLSFIKRNLKDCPKTLKELAYFSLVRSFTDYCSTVWDPHQKYNHDKLEMVQRRAARFVKSKYKRTESVTAMLN